MSRYKTLSCLTPVIHEDCLIAVLGMVNRVFQLTPHPMSLAQVVTYPRVAIGFFRVRCRPSLVVADELLPDRRLLLVIR